MHPKKFPALIGNLSGGRLATLFARPRWEESHLSFASPRRWVGIVPGCLLTAPLPPVSPLALLSSQPQFWLLEEDKRASSSHVLPTQP